MTITTTMACCRSTSLRPRPCPRPGLTLRPVTSRPACSETRIVTMLLFVGTLAVFASTPKVAYGDAGFPLLSLPGESLLKDLVLSAAGATISAMAQACEPARLRAAEYRQLRAARDQREPPSAEASAV